MGSETKHLLHNTLFRNTATSFEIAGAVALTQSKLADSAPTKTLGWPDNSSWLGEQNLYHAT